MPNARQTALGMGIPWRQAEARREGETMLKITVYDTASQLRLALEGRLAGAWVWELDQCWHTTRASHPHRPHSPEFSGGEVQTHTDSLLK